MIDTRYEGQEKFELTAVHAEWVQHLGMNNYVFTVKEQEIPIYISDDTFRQTESKAPPVKSGDRLTFWLTIHKGNNFVTGVYVNDEAVFHRTTKEMAPRIALVDLIAQYSHKEVAELITKYGEALIKKGNERANAYDL